MPRKKTNKPAKAGKSAYKHPIPGRNELLNFLEKAGKPLLIKEIISELGLRGQRSRALLEDQLHKMVRAGQIIQNRRGEFCLTAKLDLITGIVSGHKDGFGFVIRDDGGDDVYLSAR
ncbi:MAG: ribonuclease R, partial [Gammaproteobacteria bacterium]|nr:ribonuclease R [Gammaproteobacteria bacterium]